MTFTELLVPCSEFRPRRSLKSLLLLSLSASYLTQQVLASTKTELKQSVCSSTDSNCWIPDSKIMESWIKYDSDSDFPIENIPYGIFSIPGKLKPRCGTIIGDTVVDLSALGKLGFLPEETKGVFARGQLNDFMALGSSVWKKTRAALQKFFTKPKPQVSTKDDAFMFPVSEVTMHLPAAIGDYTDFYSSRPHATNVGTMFRGKDNALKENWLHLPVGYHGRASSVVVSGQDIYRPKGQTRDDATKPPIFGECRRLDFELEAAFFVGPGNKMGHPISIDEAHDQIFGIVLMNDWSARDIQKWEYVPLGPFLAKNFATTISPWIVTLDALEPFRIASEKQDPSPKPYLQDKKLSAYDVQLQVSIQGKEAKEPTIVSNSNMKYLYWTFTQQLTHHSVTGCNMRPGDLLGSGTISGPKKEEYG
mmetsp:Transcript_47221/g.75837  ORF Transcript_47221/g.75837 Transcript_47221/m.75837 type:complete len:420 (-) Transcript_47221:12-1271(-)